MQYRKLVADQTVLYSSDRTSSGDFSLSRCDKAEVVALGVHHRYYAKGGFAGGGGWRETDQGVRVRLVTNKASRGVTEFVTLAAHLLPYEGDTQAKWDEAQARIAARQAEQKLYDDKLSSLEDRFKDRGFEVHIRVRYAGSPPAIHLHSLADVERLLDLLERDGLGTLDVPFET